MLAGLIPAPSRYSPRVDLAAAEVKRLWSSSAMRDEEMITRGRVRRGAFPACSAWRVRPAPPARHARAPAAGAAVERPVLHRLRGPVVGGPPPRRPRPDLPGRPAHRDHPRPDLQESAKRHVAEFLEGTEPDLRTSLVSIEPPTGFVRAFVSGRDYGTDRVNYALGSGRRRLRPPAGLRLQALRARPCLPDRRHPERDRTPGGPTTSPSRAAPSPTARPPSSRTTRAAATAPSPCATRPGPRSTPCSRG